MVATLFWVMSFLISAEAPAVEVQKYLSVNFAHSPSRPLPTPRKRQTPEKQGAPQIAPELPPLVSLLSPTIGEMEIVMPSFQHAPLQYDATFNLNDNGDYFPILKAAPEYPPQALSRGVEGSCMVEYTVNSSGTVENVRVLKSRCDSELFHDAARLAAKKFRYRPRMRNGHPVPVSRVRNNFVFQITGD